MRSLIIISSSRISTCVINNSVTINTPILSSVSNTNLSTIRTIDLTFDTENDSNNNDSDVTSVSETISTSHGNISSVPLCNISSVTDVTSDPHFKDAYNSLLRGSQSLLARKNPDEGIPHHLYIPECC